MSNIDDYQKLCKKFKKQGTPPATVNLSVIATLYICFEDSKGGLITRTIPIEYLPHRNVLYVKAAGHWGRTVDVGNLLPTSGLGTNEYSLIEALVDHNDAVEIFESIVDRSLAEIGDKSSFYEALLNNCVWEETDNNHQVSTLAVGWDDKAGKFRLYYNPSFILIGAMAQYIYCSKDYGSLEECYNYMLKFYLIHEMSHITREHMQKGDLLKDVSHREINIYGDSFINQVIPVAVLQEQKQHPPIIGILNEITKSGRPKSNNLEYIITSLGKMLKNLTGLEAVSSSVSELSSNGNDVVIKFVMGELLYRFPNLNSNLFIKEMSEFFNNLFKQGTQDNLDQDQSGEGQSAGSADSGGKPQSGQGSQSNDKSIEDVKNRERNNNQGSQGAKEKSEDQVEQKSQEGSDSDSDDGEEGEGSPDQGDQQGSGSDSDKGKGASNAIKDALSKSVNEKDLASKLGGDPLTGEMKAGGDSKGKWRTLLSKAISQATGIKEVYDTNAPHARIQGQFGRDVEVPDFKSVLIMLDCSGSMGAEIFKKVLQELVILESQFKVKPTVYVVYWGSSAIHKKYKMNKNIYKQIAKDSKDMGGTYYEQALDYALSVCKNPDLVIDCTDAQFFELPATLRLMRKKRAKYNRKTVWVLTRDFDSKVMAEIDPQYKNKMIKLQ